VEEVTGGGEAGVTPLVSPLGGGSDETDWACATAAMPANNPRLRAVDFSRIDIAETPFLRLEYVNSYSRFPSMEVAMVHRTHA
jgi:hypothetical protein